MEVGAVKQAFNNELILIKKKLNQAKIQVIHKLTRKAKTLTEKKVPDKLKEKFNKKAQSLVKEVLIIKKIKPKDIAKFIITHKEQLNHYLNKPIVDHDKACARLALHKSMQDKYKLIRDKFANVHIKDLFMSRQERIKLKKEAREKVKNKKKAKNAKKSDNTGSEWKIEDIQNDRNNLSNDDEMASSNEGDNDSPKNQNHEESDFGDSESNLSEDGAENTHSENEQDENKKISTNDKQIKTKPDKRNIMSIEDKYNDLQMEQDNYESDLSNNESDLCENDEEKIQSDNELDDNKKILINNNHIKTKPDQTNTTYIQVTSNSKEINKNPKKKHKDVNKNKNFNEKILQRTFKKDREDSSFVEKKVVDPFFMTSTGEKYMTVAEPRKPDEIKEIHKQGNRKLRRAAMFGHVTKIKPKVHYENNYKNNNDNGFGKDSFKNKFQHEGIDKNSFNDRNYNHKKLNFNDKVVFNDRVKLNDEKPEKLHPSWEAKKRQSGILPFQGKKIVFNET